MGIRRVFMLLSAPRRNGGNRAGLVWMRNEASQAALNPAKGEDGLADSRRLLGSRAAGSSDG
jgi:hypothetical protein